MKEVEFKYKNWEESSARILKAMNSEDGITLTIKGTENGENSKTSVESNLPFDNDDIMIISELLSGFAEHDVRLDQEKQIHPDDSNNLQ